MVQRRISEHQEAKLPEQDLRQAGFEPPWVENPPWVYACQLRDSSDYICRFFQNSSVTVLKDMESKSSGISFLFYILGATDILSILYFGG